MCITQADTPRALQCLTSKCPLRGVGGFLLVAQPQPGARNYFELRVFKLSLRSPFVDFICLERTAICIIQFCSIRLCRPPCRDRSWANIWNPKTSPRGERVDGKDGDTSVAVCCVVIEPTCNTGWREAITLLYCMKVIFLQGSLDIQQFDQLLPQFT